MDCEFIEHEFYYYHLRRQGENYHDDDSLSWLVSPWLPNLDPKEQVDNTTESPDNATESPHQDILSTPPPPPVLSDHQVSHIALDNHTSPDNDISASTNRDNVIVDTMSEDIDTDIVEKGEKISTDTG